MKRAPETMTAAVPFEGGMPEAAAAALRPHVGAIFVLHAGCLELPDELLVTMGRETADSIVMGLLRALGSGAFQIAREGVVRLGPVIHVTDRPGGRLAAPEALQ